MSYVLYVLRCPTLSYAWDIVVHRGIPWDTRDMSYGGVPPSFVGCGAGLRYWSLYTFVRFCLRRDSDKVSILLPFISCTVSSP